MVYLHNGILHSNKKEETLTFCNIMDGPGEYCAKWNKPVNERQIPYILNISDWSKPKIIFFYKNCCVDQNMLVSLAL